MKLFYNRVLIGVAVLLLAQAAFSGSLGNRAKDVSERSEAKKAKSSDDEEDSDAAIENAIEQIMSRV